MAENSAARKIQAAFRKSRNFRFVLYNGTLDVGRRIDPVSFFASLVARPPQASIKEISLVNQMYRTGQLAKGQSHSLKLASWTREYGIKGDASKGFACNIKIVYGGVGHSITIYKNGKIQYAGGYSGNNWNETPKNVLNIVFPGQFTNADINLNNVMIQRSTGRVIRDLERASLLLGGSYEPEMRTFIKVERPNWTIQLFKKGVIQILKLSDPSNVKPAINDANNLYSRMRDSNLLGGVVPGVHRKSQLQNRRNNQPAPEIRRRTTTVPKDKRPTPFSFAGTCPSGMYLAPNPQGEPCCYKIPVRIEYMKPKIIERFERFGLKIPQKTKNLFGILNVNNAAKPVNVSGKDAGYRFTLERIQRKATNKRFLKAKSPSENRYDKTVFKIDSRQASRYTTKQLVDICMRLGLVKYARTTSRKALADGIQRYAESKGMIEQHQYNTNGVPRNTNYSGTGSGFKIGKRLCMSYSKPALAKLVLKVYGKRLDTSQTLRQLCIEVEGLAQQRAPSVASSPNMNMNNYARNLINAMNAKSPKNEFSDMTVKQLRGYLSTHGIKYSQTSRDKESLLKLARNKTSQKVKSPSRAILMEFAKHRGFYVKAGLKKNQLKNILEKHVAAKVIQTAFRRKRPPPSQSLKKTPSPRMKMMAYAPVESMNSPSPSPPKPQPKNLSRNNARNILQTHLKRSNFTNVELDNFRTQASRYMKYSADPSKHIRRLMKNMFG